MAHLLGKFFEYLAAFLLFSFSVTLGYSFFAEIAPAGMAWFIPAAMGLTEGGLLCWLAVFMLTDHHDMKKTIALVMIFACLVAVLVTDAVELSRWFHVSFIITPYWVYLTLILMFAFHLLAFVGGFFTSYFSVHPFNSPVQLGNLIPKRRNLIPKQPADLSIEELRVMHDAITGYLVAVGNEGTSEQDPLAQRQLPRPSDQTAETLTLAQVGQAAKEVASTLTKKVKGFTRRGKQEATAPGSTNETTNESMQTGGSKSREMAELMELYHQSGDAAVMTFPEWVSQMKEES